MHVEALEPARMESGDVDEVTQSGFQGADPFGRAERLGRTSRTRIAFDRTGAPFGSPRASPANRGAGRGDGVRACRTCRRVAVLAVRAVDLDHGDPRASSERSTRPVGAGASTPTTGPIGPNAVSQSTSARYPVGVVANESVPKSAPTRRARRPRAIGVRVDSAVIKPETSRASGARTRGFYDGHRHLSSVGGGTHSRDGGPDFGASCCNSSTQVFRPTGGG